MHSKRKGKSCTLFLGFILIMAFIIGLKYKNIMGLFYPLKYENLIVKYSTEYGLDPYIVSSIINVESHYDSYAKSNKDAKGLMQVTSSTGRWAAQKLGIKNYNDEMLYNPEINIRIGCWYLDNLKHEFDNSERETSLILMLASYNGGSGNVKKWLNDSKYSETGTSLDNIPFKETKEYIEKVLKNYSMYKRLYPNI